MDKPATRAEWEARAATLRLRTHGAASVNLIAPAGSDLRAAGTAGSLRQFGAGGYVGRASGRTTTLDSRMYERYCAR